MSSILITGGSGSFGNAFVRRWLQEPYAGRIVILSRNEGRQFEMREQLKREYPDQFARFRFFIGDVRDTDRLKRAFVGIDFIVHAAALKRIDAIEYDPIECLYTNVIGSMNVIAAAIHCGVKKVLAISSDKACSPANLYGISKAAMEKLFAAANVYSPTTRFSSVRYGNVLNSTGSILPTWAMQSAAGSLLTITNAGMTRFVFTIEQGVKFALDCLVSMQGGETFIPKLPATTVGDLARVFRPLSAWQQIGLRPGEKQNEWLLSPDESAYARDCGDRFVIYPPQVEWAGLQITGSPLRDGFCYSSASAARLSGDSLRELLERVA